jgi:DNA-binding transcriptional regulator YiaG
MTATDLKSRRAALKLSQSEMAQALRVNLRTYQAWEGGRYSLPGHLDLALRYLEEPQKKSRAKRLS